MIDTFQERDRCIFIFFQFGKRGHAVISQDGYATAAQMSGNCSQTACSQTACFQSDAGEKVLRFNSTWHSSQAPNSVEES